ncbi:MAG: hypothetical protein AAGJ35_15675, partial [Myxococcota bacterium]
MVGSNAVHAGRVVVCSYCDSITIMDKSEILSTLLPRFDHALLGTPTLFMPQQLHIRRQSEQGVLSPVGEFVKIRALCFKARQQREFEYILQQYRRWENKVMRLRFFGCWFLWMTAMWVHSECVYAQSFVDILGGERGKSFTFDGEGKLYRPQVEQRKRHWEQTSKILRQRLQGLRREWTEQQKRYLRWVAKYRRPSSDRDIRKLSSMKPLRRQALSSLGDAQRALERLRSAYQMREQHMRSLL